MEFHEGATDVEGPVLGAVAPVLRFLGQADQDVAGEDSDAAKPIADEREDSVLLVDDGVVVVTLGGLHPPCARALQIPQRFQMSRY